MTVLTTANRMPPYACDGVVKTFAYTFPVLAPEHLTVYKRSAAGVLTLLALNTDFTVTGTGDGAGGNVVCSVAPVTGYTLIIIRIVPVLQTTDFQNQGRFFPETHERAFDRDIMIQQQFLEVLGRAMQSPDADPTGPWDALGRRIVNVGDATASGDAVNLHTMLAYLADVVGSTGSISGSFGCTFDGGGAPLTPGSFCDVVVPWTCFIAKSTLLADTVGSVVISVWADTYGNYPPTVADNIAGAAPPALVGGVKSQDSALAGWTLRVEAGTTVRFGVQSCSNITRAILTLSANKA